jgi:arsenate reductase (thioredoxin)
MSELRRSPDKTRVLFLCTGNSARSQMAEALLRRDCGALFEVHSAGLAPKEIHPYTRQVLAEVGIDMADQYAKDLSIYLGRVHFGYVITVCSRAEEQCPIFPGMSIRLYWPFDDPAAAVGSEEELLAVFRRVRDEIEARVIAWLQEME